MRLRDADAAAEAVSRHFAEAAGMLGELWTDSKGA
jgi:hypothetical protein